MKILIVANHLKPMAVKLALEIVSWLEQRGHPATVAKGDASLRASIDHMLNTGLDCVFVLGGDGTLLKTAREAAIAAIPILGINLGRLGFLAELEPSEVFDCLERILTGDYIVEKRSMLDASIYHGRHEGAVYRSLNDVVVNRASFSRIVTLDVFINDSYFATYEGDGIIVATPTGSTAYSLSAGGPILAPEVDGIVITPICSHILNSRPLVVSGDSIISIALGSVSDEVMVTVDGQEGVRLQGDSRVSICKSSLTTQLIRTEPRHFFDVLKQKLSLIK